jgi:hypothetical protein
MAFGAFLDTLGPATPDVLSSLNANGGCIMTQHGKDFDRQMAIAREQMDRHYVALSVLARGENSPYWTEEFAAEMEAAKVQLEKYRNPIEER